MVKGCPSLLSSSKERLSQEPKLPGVRFAGKDHKQAPQKQTTQPEGADQ